MLLLLCGSTYAEEVTIDFNADYATLFPTLGTSSSDSHDGDFTEALTSTPVGGVTVTVSPADEGVSNANRIWSSDPRLRMYSGKITFTSASEKISKIVFTLTTNKNLVANGNSADTGTLSEVTQQSNATVTWEGNAQSVTITIAGNTQFSKAVVTLGGGSTPAQTVAARPTINPNGGKFTESVKVKINHANADAKIYYALNSGEFQLYSEAFTLTETTTVKAYAIDESCDVKQSETVEATFTKEVIEQITVAQALEITNALENGKTTSQEYDVKGYVVGTPDFQRKADGTLYGNVNFDMADSQGGAEKLTVFRAKDKGNAAYTEETINGFKDGDQIIVHGKLQKYVKNDVITPELTSGYVVAVGDEANINSVVSTATISGPVYNLAGQRVSTPQKGLFIVNGKKMVIK